MRSPRRPSVTKTRSCSCSEILLARTARVTFSGVDPRIKPTGAAAAEPEAAISEARTDKEDGRSAVQDNVRTPTVCRIGPKVPAREMMDQFCWPRDIGSFLLNGFRRSLSCLRRRKETSHQAKRTRQSEWHYAVPPKPGRAGGQNGQTLSPSRNQRVQTTLLSNVPKTRFKPSSTWICRCDVRHQICSKLKVSPRKPLIKRRNVTTCNQGTRCADLLRVATWPPESSDALCLKSGLAAIASRRNMTSAA